MTENVEMQGLPSYDGYQYTGENRFVKAGEYHDSSYRDVVVLAEQDGFQKVHILRKVK